MHQRLSAEPFSAPSRTSRSARLTLCGAAIVSLLTTACGPGLPKREETIKNRVALNEASASTYRAPSLQALQQAMARQRRSPKSKVYQVSGPYCFREPSTGRVTAEFNYGSVGHYIVAFDGSKVTESYYVDLKHNRRHGDLPD